MNGKSGGIRSLRVFCWVGMWILMRKTAFIVVRNGLCYGAEHAVLCHETYRFAVRKSPFRVTVKPFPMNKDSQLADCQILV